MAESAIAICPPRGKDFGLLKTHLKDCPDHPLALQCLARRERGFSQAKRYLSKALRIHPRLPDTYERLGDLYYGRKRVSAAETQYRRALEIARENRRRTIRFFRRETVFAPSKNELSRLKYKLGRTRVEEGNRQAALELWREALRLDSHNYAAMIDLAAHYVDVAGNLSAAVPLLKRVSREAGENLPKASALYYLGALSWVRGHRGAAFRHWRRGLEIDPAIGPEILMLSRKIEEKGDPQGARLIANFYQRLRNQVS